jgi:hypothetical protein
MSGTLCQWAIAGLTFIPCRTTLRGQPSVRLSSQVDLQYRCSSSVIRFSLTHYCSVTFGLFSIRINEEISASFVLKPLKSCISHTFRSTTFPGLAPCREPRPHLAKPDRLTLLLVTTWTFPGALFCGMTYSFATSCLLSARRLATRFQIAEQCNLI